MEHYEGSFDQITSRDNNEFAKKCSMFIAKFNNVIIPMTHCLKKLDVPLIKKKKKKMKKPASCF